MRLILFSPIFLMASIGCGSTQPSNAASCIELKQVQPFRFEGVLTRRIFPGPPNYQNVHKGDKPEPAYILRLRKPICAMGDALVDSSKQIDRIQVFPADADTDGQPLWKDLRRLVGRSVTVEGREPFGAHTGHHHAPLLLPITNISIASHR
jgi:hypothetical protein